MKEGAHELSTYLRGFRKRWNVKTDDEQRFHEFRNRALQTVAAVLGPSLTLVASLSTQYLRIIGQPPNFYSNSLYSSLNLNVVWNALEEAKELGGFIFRLESLFHLPFLTKTLEQLAAGFREDIQASGMPIMLTSNHGVFLFYPKGAQLLDEHVVNADLEWMSDYPKALAAFEHALIQSADHDKQREMLDSLRVSLEEFLRQLLGNKKSLEKNQEPLLKWMDSHGTNVETRQMMGSLFHFYGDYQNEHVKHGDGWKPAEIDFILYLTATFIHLLAELGS